jgi:head-tail adaptor
MQAGLLKDIVVIERAEDYTNPENGEQLRKWVQAWRGRAKVDFSSGSQTVVNGETVNRITKKVTIRTKPAFNDKLSMLRLVINGDCYRILAKDVRGRDMATIFTCELINE